MTPTPRYFKLGLFVILSFTLFAGFLMVFGAGEFMKKELTAETCFDESVQGLDIGSEVKYKGLRIGTVKEITTPGQAYGQPSGYILVRFALSDAAFTGHNPKTGKKGLEQAVKNGLQVYLSFKGLTGAAYLETAYFDTPASDLVVSWTSAHPFVPSRKSSIKRMGEVLNQLLENFTHINIQGMTTNLDQLLDTLNKKTAEFDLVALSDRTMTLLEEVRETNQKLSDTLGSAQFKAMLTHIHDSFDGIRSIVSGAQAPINSSLENMDKALQNLNRTADNARKLTTGLDDRLGQKLKGVSDQVDTLLKSLNTTVQMLESLVWLNTDAINKTIENFEHTSENLKQLSIEIQHYPGRLLFEKPPEPVTRERLKDGR